MIEVILLERIERLGLMGQVVKVRPGFARNFLLPQNKALRATKANLEQFEKQRAILEAKNASDRSKAEAVATKIDSLKVVVIRQASEMGQLFGSVNARDVADAVHEAGHTIERTQVQIDSPIKVLGLFPVKVKLHPEVIVKVTVNVARSQAEALLQAEKGAAILKAATEKAQVEAAFEAPVEAPPAETEAATPVKKAKKAKKEAAVDQEETAAPKAKKARTKKTAEE